MLTEAKSTNARFAGRMGGLRHKFFPLVLVRFKFPDLCVGEEEIVP